METAKQTWARRVREWKRSGLTAKRFAAANGLNAGTLSHWSWRLTKDARAAKSLRAGDSATGAATFVEVTPQSSWWRVSDRIEIVVDGEIAVRVPNDFDDETLERVLSVLGVLEDEK